MKILKIIKVIKKPFRLIRYYPFTSKLVVLFIVIFLLNFFGKILKAEKVMKKNRRRIFFILHTFYMILDNIYRGIYRGIYKGIYYAKTYGGAIDHYSL